MPKPEYAVSPQGIRAHLMDKVEEFIQVMVEKGIPQYQKLEDAEQSFKDWLWGNENV
jgi:hypothetical protein